MAEHGPCEIDGCDKKWSARGLCSKHYDRLLTNGDPLIVQTIRGGDNTARLGKWADRSAGPDACHPWTGSIDKGGYGSSSFGNGTTTKAHILAWVVANGPVPDGHDIDHECHNEAKRDGLCLGGICEHRRCCNPRHLAAKERREHFDGTVPWKRSGKANLTEGRVREIKWLLREGRLSGAKIAAMFDLTENTVSRIRVGKVHASVTIEDEPAA